VHTGEILHGGALMAFADTLGAVGTFRILLRALEPLQLNRAQSSSAPHRGVYSHGECTPFIEVGPLWCGRPSSSPEAGKLMWGSHPNQLYFRHITRCNYGRSAGRCVVCVDCVRRHRRSTCFHTVATERARNLPPRRLSSQTAGPPDSARLHPADKPRL